MDYACYRVHADFGSLTFAHGSVSLPVRIPRAPPLPFTFTLALPDVYRVSPPPPHEIRPVRLKGAEGVQSAFHRLHLFAVEC